MRNPEPEARGSHGPLSVALTLSVANTPLIARPLARPSRFLSPQAQLKKPNKKIPPLLRKERKLMDEWMLGMHWPTGYSWPPAEIEEVFPVEEVVREVYH